MRAHIAGLPSYAVLLQVHYAKTCTPDLTPLQSQPIAPYMLALLLRDHRLSDAVAAVHALQPPIERQRALDLLLYSALEVCVLSVVRSVLEGD